MPDALPRWKDDYEDTKKRRGPGTEKSFSVPWRLIGLVVLGLVVGGYFVLGWRTGERDVDLDLAEERVDLKKLRQGNLGADDFDDEAAGLKKSKETAYVEDVESDEGDDIEVRGKKGKILSSKPSKARKEWEARKKNARPEKVPDAETEEQNSEPETGEKEVLKPKKPAQDDEEDSKDNAEDTSEQKSSFKPPKFSLPDPQNVVNDYNGINEMRRFRQQEADDARDKAEAKQYASEPIEELPPRPKSSKAPSLGYPISPHTSSASGPPYLPTQFPALVSQHGCTTSLCDPTNLTYARTMILHAWRSYMKHAKGSDDLYPMNKSPRNWYGSHSLLNTPIDSLDTLWLAGLGEEYTEARSLVQDFNPTAPVTVSFFETTIRQLGGLLSAYALTGESDTMLLEKAQSLADRLSGAFTVNGGGLPMGQVNLKDGSASPLGWMGGGLGVAEVGSFQMEFGYLGFATGGKKGKEYTKRVDRANDALQRLRGMLDTKGLWEFKIMPSFERPGWAPDGGF